MSEVSGLNPKDMTPDQLRIALREARLDRDGWHTQARLAENHLARILRSPAWKLTKPLRILNLIAWKIKPVLYETESESLTLDKSAPNAWDLIKGKTTIESNGADLTNSRIALVAQWSSGEKFPASTLELLSQLIENSYSVVLISASEILQPLAIPSEIKSQITVVRKPNIGYDFGSWSTAFHLFPEIFDAEHLLIVNDSNAGPFAPLQEIITKLENSQFNLTGITDSLQIRYHLQSYFLHFDKLSLQNETIRKFWREIRHHEDKSQVIKSYELGLTSIVQAQELYAGAIFPWNLISDYWENPSIHGSKRLLELGFPFIKREALRSLKDQHLAQLVQEIAIHYNKSTTEISTLLAQKNF